MLSEANVLILDNPTDHLDLESITSLNKGLMKFSGTILFTTKDHEFNETVSNKIIEITNDRAIESLSSYDEYMGV